MEVVETRPDCDTITVIMVKVAAPWSGSPDTGARGPVREGVVVEESVEHLRELLTLDELTNRVGMSVRNVRFYTTKGLIPPPIRRGRSGYYTPDHVARLELVRELQSHGFTLAAIERYVAGIPSGSSPEDIALHRTMLAPWQSEMPVEMSRTELARRTGRKLGADDIATLSALGIVRPVARGRFQVAVSQLTVGLGLLDLGFPTEAATASAEVYAQHGRQIAEELYEVFRTIVWPAYKEAGISPDRLQEIVERLKPLSIASLVAAYESAMDETKREGIARRARST
jgi:DNA-binding transcriptional MerR regulator